MRIKDIIYIIFVTLVIGLFSLCLGKTFSQIDYQKELYTNKVSECKKEVDSYIIVANDDMSYCEYLLSTYEPEYTFYDVLWTFMSNFNHYVLIGAEILMAISLILEILGKLKYRYPEKYLVRKSYKSFLGDILKCILKVILVIPIMMLISYLIMAIYIKFNFGTPYEEFLVDYFFINYGKFTYLILNILNTIILFGVYANICLFICRRERKSLLSIVLAFLYFMLIELILSVVINSWLVGNVLNIKNPILYFNIFAITNYSNDPFIYKELLSSTLYLVLSFIPVILTYYNKEKLIIDTSK